MITVPIPLLAAAGLALILVSGGVSLALRSEGEPSVLAPAASPGTGLTGYAGGVDPAADSAVAELERTLAAGRERLDSTTVRVLEENLAIIDRAIGEARRALAADPASLYLNRHLAQILKRKVGLLRRASAITGARS